MHGVRVFNANRAGLVSASRRRMMWDTGQADAPRRRGEDRRILLILRTPPPYGGGETIGAQLQQLFAGKYSILAFQRGRHSKRKQGRLTLANLVFGMRYVAISSIRLVLARPSAVYIDLPKDAPSFVRTSLILLVARALRIPVVGDLAGADFLNLDGRSPGARYCRWALRGVHVVRVLGASIAATLAARGVPNTEVLSNGIAEPPGARDPRLVLEGPARLLYVGELSEAKGIVTLLGMMREFASSGVDAKLDLVGDWESDATRKRVLALRDEWDLHDSVALHGLLVGDAKWGAFRRAHVLVHPTSWDGQPVTILEAFAFGVPVVATRVGAIPDTIRDGVEGYLMADNSVGELAAGVRSLVADRKVHATYARRARQAYAERFSADVFAPRIAELLEAAAASRGAARHAGQDVSGRSALERE
jgi:glycosyltransferase involved in cell wall biosynthesis